MDVERTRTRQADVTQRLREIYGPEPLGGMMSAAVRRLENTDEFLFDSIEQIGVDRWHNGRVVLLGDAAWCPTLYSGVGATSALAGADTLGLMFTGHSDDVKTALSAWENRLRPAIASFQQSAYPVHTILIQTSAKGRRGQGISVAMRQFVFKFPALMNLVLRFKHFRLRNSNLATDLI